MTEQQVKQLILRELPGIMQSDREVREFILRLSREQFADKQETGDRFDRVLDELRRDREEQARKWDENRQEINAILESLRANDRKWEESRQESSAILESLRANDRKWEESRQEANAMLKSIEALARKHESTIGAQRKKSRRQAKPRRRMAA